MFGTRLVSAILAKESKADLEGVTLSHLHNDYAGGLKDLIPEAPDLPIYIGREHWKAFREHPFFASMEGATPNHWPKDFSPKIIDLLDKSLEPWKQSYPLTDDGRIVVVDTSGHVPGHIGVFVYSENEGEEKKRVTYFPSRRCDVWHQASREGATGWH
ncbi:hypothetical protein N7486_008049 [Penicillium sp. IBT 16267x]|nr:hypothetical protein N7486_008049 [Penicillium sp. IBT 16267x]